MPPSVVLGSVLTMTIIVVPGVSVVDVLLVVAGVVVKVVDVLLVVVLVAL